jgi:hypothetical protein
MTDRPVTTRPDSREQDDSRPPPPLGGAGNFFAGYFWFLLKNLLGIIFLAAALVLGPLPGPGGIVFFLIGFGLISFPGKRRLMVRIFRGRPFKLHNWLLHAVVLVLASAAPLAILWYVFWRDHNYFPGFAISRRLWVGLYILLIAVTWVVLQGLLRLGNLLVRAMPKIRRKVRPWLRHHGIDLLPPRLKPRVRLPDGRFAWRENNTGDIVRIHQRHHDRFWAAWYALKPWLKRFAGVAITLAIFAWMLKPVVTRWDEVRQRVLEMNWSWFVLASAMFAAFLFCFRVLSWRKILAGFDHRLPLAPATRIWSTSELARYLPGVIWQVVGRVYLVRPYGVSGTVCSASQILELVVFLLANVLVAVSCLLWFGTKMDPEAAKRLYVIMCLVPLLMLLLHPKIFYTILTRYMTARGKPLPPRRVRGKTLTLLCVWAIVGLLWQSLALWLLTHEPLGLPPAKWWVVAGSYCLAWCAGFLAFWAPGGIGVREFVFVKAMMFALPPPLRTHFGDEAVLFGFLVFLGIVLRLWATSGELLLASIAYAIDYRGALGRPDAPGRVAVVPAEG